jgi:hypothetical protein
MFTIKEQSDCSYGIINPENNLYFSTFDLFWAKAVVNMLNKSKDIQADTIKYNLPKYKE